MPLQIKHVSERNTISATATRHSRTQYGTKDEVEAYMAAFKPGNTDILAGYELDDITAVSVAGGGWEVEETFIQRTTPQGVPFIAPSGATEQSLSTRMISIQLSALTASYWVNHGYAYKTNWNYALAALGSNTQPSWWATATTLIIPVADRDKYAWLDNENDVANMPPKNGQYWGILKEKVKPGVDSIYFPVYEIIESSRHKNKEKTAWIALSKAGTIVQPSLGNFGITWGNWLCMGATVSKEGTDWVAQVIYQHSPVGWDVQLYPVF
jgi:hypothetical protein